MGRNGLKGLLTYIGAARDVIQPNGGQLLRQVSIVDGILEALLRLLRVG
jgi:hypothetical protein